MRHISSADISAMRTMPRLKGTEETGPADPEEIPMKKCPECEDRGIFPNPSGEWPSDCPWCHGTGQIANDDPAEPEPMFDAVEEAKGER